MVQAYRQADRGDGEESEPSTGGEQFDAEADLDSSLDDKLDAEAAFYEEAGVVRVIMEVTGAVPGEHGVHVHEKGDCSDPLGDSMGAHLGPDQQPHGLPADPERHLGDLGNIVVGDDGRGRLDIVVLDATLDPIGGDMSFVGKALVLDRLDDTGKGTSGQGGIPIACGVIKAAG